MHLNNRARDLLDKYSSGMAQQFGARDTSRYFSLNDPQENALRLALLESVEFLNMITCLDVDQLSGQVISVGSSVLHTGRSENGRFVRQVGVDGNDYSLVETDSCAALRWDLLSVWANAGKDENEFYNLVQAFTTQAFALDMLRIGFNGKSRAKTTNPTDTQAGDWVRQTDQTISETSMARTVKADTEQRELVSRETMIKATDKTTVLGTATLMAGAIQQVSAGDYSQAVKGNRLASIEGNDETDITGKQSTKVAGAVDVDVGGTLTEKIAALRKSVAAGGQQIMGPTVHIGSESVNTLTMMLDTIDLLAELAQQCASHSHPSVGTPTNAGAFTQTAEKAGQTRSKYQKIIA